jgi:hypothetical protein
MKNYIKIKFAFWVATTLWNRLVLRKMLAQQPTCNRYMQSLLLLRLLLSLLLLAPQSIVGLILLHQQPSSLTKLVQASHINVIYQFIISQWDQIGYPRQCCMFLNWYVLHGEVFSLMRNPLSGGQGVFLLETHTPSPCSSHYSWRAAAAVLVCPEYFISPIPSTWGGTRWETANSTQETYTNYCWQQKVKF